MGRDSNKDKRTLIMSYLLLLLNPNNPNAFTSRQKYYVCSARFQENMRTVTTNYPELNIKVIANGHK